LIRYGLSADIRFRLVHLKQELEPQPQSPAATPAFALAQIGRGIRIRFPHAKTDPILIKVRELFENADLHSQAGFATKNPQKQVPDARFPKHILSYVVENNRVPMILSI